MGTIHPDSDQIRNALEKTPAGTPIVMVNLLRFREQAVYPGGGSAMSGKAAYREYGRLAIRHIQAVGGELLYSGASTASLIGPTSERWDEVVLVRYPSIGDFLRMINQPEYQAITSHRTAALEDSRLFATVEE